jgi:hypothetical protein
VGSFCFHDPADALRPLGFGYPDESQAGVIWRVPRNVVKRRQRQPFKPLRHSPAGSFADEIPAQSAAGVQRMDGHLLDVGVLVHLVNEEVGDRSITGIRRHPGPAIPLVGGQLIHTRRRVVGDGSHVDGPKRFAGSDFDVLHRPQVIFPGFPDHRSSQPEAATDWDPLGPDPLTAAARTPSAASVHAVP